MCSVGSRVSQHHCATPTVSGLLAAGSQPLLLYATIPLCCTWKFLITRASLASNNKYLNWKELKPWEELSVFAGCTLKVSKYGLYSWQPEGGGVEGGGARKAGDSQHLSYWQHRVLGSARHVEIKNWQFSIINGLSGGKGKHLIDYHYQTIKK